MIGHCPVLPVSLVAPASSPAAARVPRERDRALPGCPAGTRPLPLCLPVRPGAGRGRCDAIRWPLQRRRPAQHHARRPRRVPAHAVQAGARPARLRRRRGGVRGPDEGLVGGARPADGEPLPVRPARGRRQAHAWSGRRTATATAAPATCGRRCASTPPTPPPPGRAPSRTSTASSRSCWRSSTPSRSCPRTRSPAAWGRTATAPSQPFPLVTRVAQARSDGGADFWSAIGGTYKASIDFVITLTAEPGTDRGARPRGAHADAAPRLAGEPPRHAGREPPRRRHGRATPTAARSGDAWVALPTAGAWTSTDGEGKFRFDRVAPGSYTCVARTADGQEAVGELVVPGQRRRPRRRRIRRSADGDRWGSATLPEWLAIPAYRRGLALRDASCRRGRAGKPRGRACCSEISSPWCVSA